MSLYSGRIAATMLENLPWAVSTSVPMVILLDVDIKACSYPGFSNLLAKKPVFVHVDLMRGVSPDREGLLFLKEHVGIAGIVSTKNNIIRTARSIGLKAIQRTFLIDTASLESSLDTFIRNPPDAIEFMPGLAVSIVPYLKSRLDIPIILAGLIQTEAEVQAAFSAGADAVSMSKRSLWEEP